MEKQVKRTGLKNWFYNIKNTKKNYRKIKSSPYAALKLSLKIRKMILIPLIIYIAYMGINMVINYSGRGFMQTFGRVVMIGVFVYLIYRIYGTIPQAKKQLEYYKKYPHTINYCPTNVKEDVDDILKKIKENKIKKDSMGLKKGNKSEGGRNKNVRKKQEKERRSNSSKA